MRNLLNRLPALQGRKDLIVNKQTVYDIIREVCRAHSEHAKDYDKLVSAFEGGSVLAECKRLFDFCKKIPYKIETEDSQTTRTPAGIISMASFGADCKHYAGFIAGVLDAIARHTGQKIDWCYRFASYDLFNADPGHVFVVVREGGREIWIDPVLDSFNQRTPSPYYKIDKKIPMGLYRISGFNSTNTVRRNVGSMAAQLVLRDPNDIFNRMPVYVPTKFDDLNKWAAYQPTNTHAYQGLMFAFIDAVKAGTATAADLDTMHSIVTDVLPNNKPISLDAQEWFYKWFPIARPVVVQPVAPVAPAAVVVPGSVYQTKLVDYMVDPFINNNSPHYTKTPATYLVNGVAFELPAPTLGRGVLPQDVVTVYPETWQGYPVPLDLPKPIFVGNRILLLPKREWGLLLENNYRWSNFLVSVMAPLVAAYSVAPEKLLKRRHGNAGAGDTDLSRAIQYDMDYSDVVDYVTNMPTLIPITAGIPAGVRYILDGEDLKWPGRNTPGTVPPEMPPIIVTYPEFYQGVKVPLDLPKPICENKILTLMPKGIDWGILKERNFFWLSFLCSVMSPLINAYSFHGWADQGNKLADRILYDVDDKDVVGDYLQAPEVKTWLGNVIAWHIEYIESVGRGMLKFINAGSRLAFLGLVRVNAFAYAYKLYVTCQDPGKYRALTQRWKDLGGVVGALEDAIILGCKNNPFLGGGIRHYVEMNVRDNQLRDSHSDVIFEKSDVEPFYTSKPNPNKLSGAKIGVAGGDDVAYYVAAASAIIVALGPFIKGITGDEGDKIIDGTVDAMNAYLIASGEDPIRLGGDLQVPTEVKDPNTGKVITINPPAPNGAGKQKSITQWATDNPALAAGIGVFAAYNVYDLSRPKNQRVIWK